MYKTACVIFGDPSSGSVCGSYICSSNRTPLKHADLWSLHGRHHGRHLPLAQQTVEDFCVVGLFRSNTHLGHVS